MQRPTIFRMAMPLSVPQPITEQMMGNKNEGWALDIEGAQTPPDMGIKKVEEALPGFDLTLPKIIRYRPSDIRTINGKKCLVVDYEESKDYQRITKATPQRVKDMLVGNHYPGLVRTINLDTGMPETFTYDDVFDQIKGQSEVISEESRQKINKEIQAYNKRIDELDAATANMSRLPLQIAKAEDMVRERISVLETIIAVTDAKIEELKSQKPAGIGEMEEHVEQAIKGGNLGEKDFVDYVVHHYAYRYDELVNDLQSGALQIPAGIQNAANLKIRLMNMGQAAFDSYTTKKKERMTEKPVTSPFDIANQDIVGNLQELQQGDVPASYKTPGFHNLKGYIGSLQGTIIGCRKNRDRLVPIADGMAEIRNTIGKLPAGQRSQEYVSGPEGQVLLDQIADLCNNKLRGWAETFSRDIVDQTGRIDTRHFGKSGSMGNAMLIVALTRLFKIMSTFLKKSGWTKPDEAQAAQIAESIDIGAEHPVPVQVPVQQAKTKTTIKLSKAQWKEIGRNGGWLQKKTAGKKLNYNGVEVMVMPIDKIEHLDGPWWLWSCEIEMPDGSIRTGSIEGDGHMWADETLEFDDDGGKAI
jgi:hypothetical protein